MGNELTIKTTAAAVTPATERLRDTAARIIDAATSDSTRRVYATQWRQFADFCNGAGLDPLPAAPETVALYIGHLVDTKKSASTIGQALAAIAAAHVRAGLESPTTHAGVKLAARGARRTVGVAPHKKAAARVDVLRLLVDALDTSTLQGLRDRAVLLLGFAGAFRRSELAALQVDDIEQTTAPDGRAALLVHVRRSKTDQEGAGMVRAIFSAACKNRALCPVAALREYVNAAGVSDGPLFRRIRRGGHVQPDALTGQAIARIVQHAAARAGVSLDMGGHSLRSGFITSALEGGASERSVMTQTGHKSVSVMRGYMQRVDALTDNAAAMVL